MFLIFFFYLRLILETQPQETARAFSRPAQLNVGLYQNRFNSEGGTKNLMIKKKRKF